MGTRNTAAAPLAGVRVLEVSTRAAGGYCGRLLHLLGATVSRVTVAPSVDCPPELLAEFEAALHAGKATIGADDIAGQDTALATSSILVVDCLHDDTHGGAVTAVARRVADARPDTCSLVDVSSHRDPDIDDTGGTSPASSIIAGAHSGLISSLGKPDREPLSLPFDLADYFSGTEAATAAVVGVLLRDGGVDRALSLDVSATDVLTYFIGQIGSNYLPYGRPWHRDGARATMSGGSYPAAMFPCRDGWISVMCRTPGEYRGLLSALGNPQWSRRPGYDDPRIVAMEHADEVDTYVTAWTTSLTRDEVFAASRRHGFATGSVLTMAEVLVNEHLNARGFFQPVSSGRVVPGSPFRLARTQPGGAPRAARRSERPARPSLARPLDGLRVLDMTWVWSGPMVTAALADLGATVIKIEHRGRPDPTRLRGPALRDGVPIAGPLMEVAPFFNQVNHGKLSVEVDLSTDDGARLVHRLADHVDVLVENMRPGALERRGLSFDALSATNPDLVMLSMSVFGRTGPLRDVRGYAPVMSGTSGLDSLVGYGDDLIGTFNPAVGDPNGAGHGLVAVLASVVAQRRGAGGCHIDVSQVEALLSTQLAPVLLQQVAGNVAPPGNRHSTFWPHGIYRCAGDDAWVAVVARNNSERSRLASLVGIEVDADPATYEVALSDWARKHDASEAEHNLTALSIPAARVAGFEAVEGPRARRRGLNQFVEHPFLGRQRVMVPPWKCNGLSFHAPGAAPLLGADTDQVLHEVLGMNGDELAALRAAKVISHDAGQQERPQPVGLTEA
ncbi:CoA transferase [Dactylosporangium sp. CA-152071]|uniref:CaiB/BaiF CoA-transferase family protein n=1 Tax=Dactylosporangium sp. CA-152071 TaxID=3239933 RepID=UPI003D8F598B